MNLNRDFNLVIYDMVKEANPNTTLTAADIEVGAVSVNADENITKNTKLALSADASSTGFTGQTEVFYDRLDLDDVLSSTANGDFFAVMSEELGNEPEDVTAAVAAALAVRFSIACTAADFKFIEGTSVQNGAHILEAADGSFWFKGSATVELADVGATPPPQTGPMAMDEAIQNKILNGLDMD